jgi:hypothetical protein
MPPLPEGTAVYLARTGRPEQSARIAGAAAALREAIGVPWASATDRERVEAELAAARAALGQAFDACYESGRALADEDAVEEALSGLAGP